MNMIGPRLSRPIEIAWLKIAGWVMALMSLNALACIGIAIDPPAPTYPPPTATALALQGQLTATAWSSIILSGTPVAVPAPKLARHSISPDGAQAALADGNAITVWDTSTGQQVATLTAEINGNTQLGFGLVVGPVQNRVAAFGCDHWTDKNQDLTSCRYVLVWNVTTGQLIAPPIVANRPQYESEALAFSADGSLLAIADDTVGVWRVDPAQGPVERIHQFDLSGASAVTLSPDGKTLAAGRDSGWLQVWDVATSEEVYRGSVEGLFSLAFSNNGYLAAVGYRNLTVWNTASFNVVSRSSTVGGHHAVFSPDGHYLAMTEYQSTAIYLWDVATNNVLRMDDVPGANRHNFYNPRAGFSPDGQTLSLAAQQGAPGEAQAVFFQFDLTAIRTGPVFKVTPVATP